MDFHQKSYDLHTKSYEKLVTDEDDLDLYRNWFDNDTIDLWRHRRMLEVLDPFLNQFPGSAWLTVGDGCYGTSSTYISIHGGRSLPTDIDISLLERGKREGIIDDFKYANAEDLPFDDGSFDYVYCKEAFHHFPRPYLAVYEMLRCARKAIILTEPNDWVPSPIIRRILQLVKNWGRSLLGKKIPHPDDNNYEPIGNYVYTISIREFQKIALGLALPAVAYKQFHDVYEEGVEHEMPTDDSPMFKRIKRKIKANTLQKKLGLNNMNHINIIIFKESPSPELRSDLQKKGFKVVDLPKNQFI